MKILYNDTIRDMTDEEETVYKEDVEKNELTGQSKLESLIRAKYSVEDEVRLIRDADEAKDEYKAYRKYCKECEKSIKKANN